MPALRDCVTRVQPCEFLETLCRTLPTIKACVGTFLHVWEKWKKWKIGLWNFFTKRFPLTHMYRHVYRWWGTFYTLLDLYASISQLCGTCKALSTCINTVKTFTDIARVYWYVCTPVCKIKIGNFHMIFFKKGFLPSRLVLLWRQMPPSANVRLLIFL